MPQISDVEVLMGLFEHIQYMFKKLLYANENRSCDQSALSDGPNLCSAPPSAGA